METINAILVLFGYVRQKFVPVTFLLNKIFVAQTVVDIFGTQKNWH